MLCSDFPSLARIEDQSQANLQSVAQLQADKSTLILP